MTKFSIIIPVFNVEKYIKRCLDSVFEQTYKDFEVIVVDDGCTDDSINIIKNYSINIIKTKHVGVSEARNIGAKHANGEFLLFLDSDDYWDKDLLKELSKSLKNSPDLIRFQARTVTDNLEKIDYKESGFQGLNGESALKKIVKYHFIDSIWIYAIKREYFEKEKFYFKKGMVHEDFGLTPLIIIKAKNVNSISYIGYNYYHRSGSIMNNTNYEWTKKKVSDLYEHYLYLISEIDKTELNKEVFKSFCANNLIIKICELKGKDYRKYRKLLKKNRVYDNLLTDTFPRKIKKLLFIISPKLTVKLLK